MANILMGMLIVTTDGLPGYEIHEVIGEALGVSQRLLGPSGGSSSEIQLPGGGDTAGSLTETRRAAIAQLSRDAQRRGANAVVGLAFDTVDIGGRSIEVCAYGTAVVARPVARAPEPRHGVATGGDASAGGYPSSGYPSVGYPSTARQPGPAVVGRDVTISGTRPSQRPRDSGERARPRDGGEYARPRDSGEHTRPGGDYPRSRDRGDSARRADPVVGRDVTISGTRSTGERTREDADHVQQIRREPPEHPDERRR